MTNSVASPLRPVEARRELAKRELARRGLAEYMAYASRGKVEIPPHIALLVQKLEAVERGEIKRLIVSMPPRHGKSWTISKFFSSWFLGRNPDKSVMLCSYGASFAKRWGGRAKALLAEFGQRLWGLSVSDNTSAKDEWEIAGREGGMKTAGVGGDVTGRGANLLLVDDLVKNDEEANSETYRERAWEWFLSTAYTRLEPGGACVVVMTRWNQDDLCGRLAAAELEGGERWERVELPALAEEVDILGRTVGAPLWPDRFGLDRLAEIKRAIGSYWWSALYQQRPTQREGNVFKTAWMRYYTRQGQLYQHASMSHGIEAMQRWSTVDLAFSENTSADYSAIFVWGFSGGHLWLLHVIRERVTEAGLDARLRGVEANFGCRVHWVEEGAYKKGEGTIKYLRSQGRPIRVLGAEHGVSKDKEQRAHDATPRLEAGLVLLPQHAEWRADFDAELYAFPRGKYDDQVDAFVYGIAVAPWGGGGAPLDLLGQRPQSKVMGALDAMRALGGR